MHVLHSSDDIESDKKVRSCTIYLPLNITTSFQPLSPVSTPTKAKKRKALKSLTPPVAHVVGRRSKIRQARVQGEAKRREQENFLDGTLDYSIPENADFLIYRYAELYHDKICNVNVFI